MKIVEPLKQDKKLIKYLDENVKKVLIFFWHGLGDLVQFLAPFDVLKSLYPNIQFDLALAEGLDQEEIYPNALLVKGEETIDFSSERFKDYDIIARINFPVETDPNLTKNELCCKAELGISPVWGHKKLPDFPSRLIGVHFQNTALPDVFNPSKEVAEKIWNEVLNAGFIPIELEFLHAFHNPQNIKFDFIDCTVRRVEAKISTLLGLLRVCAGVICVVSGPLHCALALMPEKVLYLEKDVPIERFTHLSIPKVNIKDDKFEEGKIKEWLLNLEQKR